MLALLDAEEIMAHIDRRLCNFINNVSFRPSDEAILLYVSREKVAGKAKAGFTSYRQMNNLSLRLKEKFSRDVEVIYSLWENHQDLESAIHNMLNHRFKGKVLSFYMSFVEEDKVNAWVEVIDEGSQLNDEIEKYYKKLIEDAGFHYGLIQWINSQSDLPTFPWLLRFLKLRQPINLKEFLGAISEEFPTISEKWLNHKLDQLRKKKLIIREKSGNYALTSEALSVVPAGANYRSSDIGRALDLGRRKW